LPPVKEARILLICGHPSALRFGATNSEPGDLHLVMRAPTIPIAYPAQDAQSCKKTEKSGEEMPKLVESDLARVSEIIATSASLEGPTLPILHAVQEEFGYIPEEAVPLIASALNLSRAEIHGTITFYHDFRRAPAGKHVLKLCRAEACQSMHGPQIAKTFLDSLGIDWGGTTSDGALTVEGVYCLGLCACAPSGLFDGEPLGRLDQQVLDEAAREARRS